MAEEIKYETLKQTSVISSRDAKFHHLTAMVMEEGSAKAHLELATELQARITVDAQIEEVFSFHFDKEIP